MVTYVRYWYCFWFKSLVPYKVNATENYIRNKERFQNKSTLSGLKRSIKNSKQPQVFTCTCALSKRIGLWQFSDAIHNVSLSQRSPGLRTAWSAVSPLFLRDSLISSHMRSNSGSSSEAIMACAASFRLLALWRMILSVRKHNGMPQSMKNSFG